MIKIFYKKKMSNHANKEWKKIKYGIYKISYFWWVLFQKTLWRSAEATPQAQKLATKHSLQTKSIVERNGRAQWKTRCSFKEIQLKKDACVRAGTDSKWLLLHATLRHRKSKLKIMSQNYLDNKYLAFRAVRSEWTVTYVVASFVKRLLAQTTPF